MVSETLRSIILNASLRDRERGSVCVCERKREREGARGRQTETDRDRPIINICQSMIHDIYELLR